VEADVEYVGEVEEIVELDYRRTCVVVFVCCWVRTNYREPNATVKRDKWGFTLANFQSCERFGRESFAFPRHCEQVFFSDTLKLVGWRVVLQREVRGRRMDNLTSESGTPLLFERGRDDNFEGLRAPEIISEDIQSRQGGGTVLQRQDVFKQLSVIHI